MEDVAVGSFFNLWRTLPLDLLQLVFARLPLPDEIIRLRVLSKTWDRYLTGVTPGFTKVCAKSNPSIFGMLPPARVLHGFCGLPDQVYMTSSQTDGIGFRTSPRWKKRLRRCVLVTEG